MSDQHSEPIATIQKNARERVHIDLTEFKGHNLMVGPLAKPLAMVVPGNRRFYFKMINDSLGTSNAGTTPTTQFAFAVRMFDLSLTTIPLSARTPL